MNVLYLGFAIPDDVLERLLATDRGMPVQTHKFGWSVIEAMMFAGIDVEVLSAEPASDYPFNSRIFFRGRRFVTRGVRGTSVPFINLTGLKHVTRYLSLAARIPARRKA